MALKAIYQTIDEIPEQYRDLYSERNGQYELTGVEGIKTQADVERVQVGAQKERDAHKATKEKLAAYQELGDPEEIQSKLDKYPELEAAAADKVDDEKINQIVEARVKSHVAPLERENAKLRSQVEERDSKIGEYETRETRRTIGDEVSKTLGEAKVLDSAREDALMLAERVFEIREDDGAIVTRDGVGVTPGISPKEWLGEIQEKRPHWWGPSQGGGANGGGAANLGVPGGGKNPWSKEGWNLTQQGRIVREHGSEKASQLAKQAGSELGATVAPE